MANLPVLSFAKVLPDNDRYWANALQLSGKIAGKYSIEMQIQPVREENAFAMNSGECIEVEGFYAYLSQVKPLQLEGRFCPSNGGIMLEFKDGGESKEAFEGKWDANKREISGTWKFLSTGKSSPFSLTASDVLQGKANMEAYWKFLRGQFRTNEPDVIGLAIQELGHAEEGFYLEGIEWGWNGDFMKFSATQLVGYGYYSSTARSSSEHFNYQLLKSNAGLFVLAWEETDNYDKPPFDAPEDEEGNYYETFEFSLYEWDGEDFNTIEKGGFPADFPMEWEGENVPEKHSPRMLVLQDRLRLSVEGKTWKLKWENGKFVSF